MYQYRKKNDLDHIKLVEMDFADSFGLDHTDSFGLEREMMELTTHYARHMNIDS